MLPFLKGSLFPIFFRNKCRRPLLFLAFFCMNCQESVPIIEQNFVNLYVDLQLATLGNENNQERAWKSRQVILKKYDQTAMTFSKEINKIKANSEIWLDFQNRVISRVEEVEKIHKGEKDGK